MANVTKKSIATDPMPVFRERFRNLVDNEGGQSAFASKVGISRQSVGFWYNSTRTPDAESLLLIANACNVPIDWLLGHGNFNNRSTDQNVYEMAEYTGLSHEAIEVLHKWMKADFYKESPEWVNILSKLITTDIFGEEESFLIISTLCDYLRHDESILTLVKRNESSKHAVETVLSIDLKSRNQYLISDSMGEFPLTAAIIREGMWSFIKERVESFRAVFLADLQDHGDIKEGKSNGKQ